MPRLPPTRSRPKTPVLCIPVSMNAGRALPRAGHLPRLLVVDGLLGAVAHDDAKRRDRFVELHRHAARGPHLDKRLRGPAWNSRRRRVTPSGRLTIEWAHQRRTPARLLAR